jgi:glc operon protein GlcG
MRLEQARAVVDSVLAVAPAPLSAFVSDAHGELVAAAKMDGAEPDTRLNAQRKAYTAARGKFRSTGELAAAVGGEAVELASFDPFFTFFKGGVAAFERGARIGAVGVSGLPGDEDDRVARQAILAAGLALE